jgi:hypothetical protein
MLLDRSERAVESEQPCPLSGESLTQKRLQCHLGKDMQQIAFFILPGSFQEDEDDEQDDDDGGSEISLHGSDDPGLTTQGLNEELSDIVGETQDDSVEPKSVGDYSKQHPERSQRKNGKAIIGKVSNALFPGRQKDFLMP